MRGVLRYATNGKTTTAYFGIGRYLMVTLINCFLTAAIMTGTIALKTADGLMILFRQTIAEITALLNIAAKRIP